MENSFPSLLEVKIDFAQSHTFFPTIVIWTLVFLLVLIFVFNGIPYIRSLLSGESRINITTEHVDKIKLIGTLVLTVGYFMLMEYVGSFFPNMGYGFLFISIPFILLLSLLYVEGLDKKKLVAIVLNAILAPSIAWFVLAKLFNITLP